VTVPHWDDAPDVWDTLTLGAVTLPGVSRLIIARELKVDEKDPKGKNAATLTVQGVKNASGTIKNVISTVEELTALQAALAVVEPKAGKGAPVPFDVVHPVATLRGLVSVLVTKVSGPELVDGLMTTTLDWKQFDVPAKPAVVPGKGGGAGGGAYAKLTTAPITGFFQILGVGGTEGLAFSGTCKPDPANAASNIGVWTRNNNYVFNGMLLGEDPNAKKAADEADKKAAGGKDATTTPGKSKSVDLTELDKPSGSGGNAPPTPPPSESGADP